MKKYVLILTAMLVIILLVGCAKDNKISDNSGNKHDDTIVDNSEKEKRTIHISGEKILDSLIFSDIKIIELEKNQNLLMTTVTNNSSGDILSQVLDIELLKDDYKSYGIVGAILPQIEPLGTITLEAPIAEDVMETNDIEIRFTGNILNN